jgi:hypothetical protein
VPGDLSVAEGHDIALLARAVLNSQTVLHMMIHIDPCRADSDAIVA